MKVDSTKIAGVLIIEPDVFEDSRGWFFESFSKKELQEHGIVTDFVQDSNSFSQKVGTLRGLHFQKNPKTQAKLVRCTAGKVLDVVVDLRHQSPTYKEWISIELSHNNKKQLFIPKSLAHGFISLTDNVEMQYKLDEYYSPEHEITLRYNDPELSIDWKNTKPILSAKDKSAPLLKDCDFIFD